MSDHWYVIGHDTDSENKTGCTVILFREQVPAAVDVRGGAPGTRETTLLASGRRGLVDAIVLSGGSAFGLATADGVMDFLASQGRGHPTPAGPVPLVPAAIIYDLAVGNPVAPDAAAGYRAAQTAQNSCVDIGAIGAGTGATVAKLAGNPSPSGIGYGRANSAAGMVEAVVVLNAVGDIVDPATGSTVRGATDGHDLRTSGIDLIRTGVGRGRAGENTTIGCLLVDATTDHSALQRIAIAAHNGLARTVVPAHTPFDGDTFFVAGRALGTVEIEKTAALSAAATIAVERAILSIFSEA